METELIRKKLHEFIDTIEDKKAAAIYTLFEDEIEADEEYPQDFKDELDRRAAYYKNGGKMYTMKEVSEHIRDIVAK
jgi:signal recognition particle subunit SEC65